jgi:hypothetical protein
MQRGRSPGRLELCEEPDRLAGRERVDRNAAPTERIERLRIGLEPSVRTGADHEPGGELVEKILEVLENELVAFEAPPARDDPAGKHDHISVVHVAIDDHPAELIGLDPAHARSVAPSTGRGRRGP